MDSEFTDKMNQMGLQRISGQIATNIRNAIWLKTEVVNEADLALGQTKIGGRPDLPAGFEWPVFNDEHLAFIAQINLAEVAKYDTDKLLPDNGLLSFFYDAGQEAWGFDPEDFGSWRVSYFNVDPKSLERKEFPDGIPEEARFRACKARFMNGSTLPAWDSIYIEELNLSETESDAYSELDNEDYQNTGYHKLLGHPRQIQGNMQLECQLVANGLYCGDSTGYRDPRRPALEKSVKDWRLLLEIDSDDSAGMMWGDSGRVYYWIREADLKNRQFDKVWMIFQCY